MLEGLGVGAKNRFIDGVGAERVAVVADAGLLQSVAKWTTSAFGVEPRLEPGLLLGWQLIGDGCRQSGGVFQEAGEQQGCLLPVLPANCTGQQAQDVVGGLLVLGDWGFPLAGSRESEVVAFSDNLRMGLDEALPSVARIFLTAQDFDHVKDTGLTAGADPDLAVLAGPGRGRGGCMASKSHRMASLWEANCTPELAVCLLLRLPVAPFAAWERALRSGQGRRQDAQLRGLLLQGPRFGFLGGDQFIEKGDLLQPGNASAFEFIAVYQEGLINLRRRHQDLSGIDGDAQGFFAGQGVGSEL